MGGPVRRHRKPLIVGQAPLRHSSAPPRLRAIPRHSRAPSVIPAPPLRHSRESGNPGAVEGSYSGVSPPHPTWIPAFAGMTGAGRPRSFRGRQTCWPGTPHGRNTSRALFTSASFPRPLRHSRESGNPGAVEGSYSGVSPPHPTWIPAFAGMTCGCARAHFETVRHAGGELHTVGTRHPPCSPPRHSRAPSVIPAKAGIQGRWRGPTAVFPRLQAFAGMTGAGRPRSFRGRQVAGNSTR